MASCRSCVARLTAWGNAHGVRVDEVVTEVGWGLTCMRRKLLAILANAQVNVNIVEHHDRLARFGVGGHQGRAGCFWPAADCRRVGGVP